jgi:hypothetical protein
MINPPFETDPLKMIDEEMALKTRIHHQTLLQNHNHEIFGA